MMILPVVVIFLALQRRFVEGLTQGGLRGKTFVSNADAAAVFRPLYHKVRGCLYGGAIGDALARLRSGSSRRKSGSATARSWSSWSRGMAHRTSARGDGRFTDDTHMTMLLGQIYAEEQRHLDPFIFAQRIVPLIADEPRWLAERGIEMPLVDRLFYPEKWLLTRLRLANADPRLGGVGNMVNCGAAMYAAPVGIVNAADPGVAYREAIDIFTAHQWSYGLEAAGVMAASVAAAFARAPPSMTSSLRHSRLRKRARAKRLAQLSMKRAATMIGARPSSRYGRRCSPLTAAPRTARMTGAMARMTGSQAGANRSKSCRLRSARPGRCEGRLPGGDSGRGQLRAGQRFHRRHGGVDCPRPARRRGHPRGLGGAGEPGQPDRSRSAGAGSHGPGHFPAARTGRGRCRPILDVRATHGLIRTNGAQTFHDDDQHDVSR